MSSDQKARLVLWFALVFGVSCVAMASSVDEVYVDSATAMTIAGETNQRDFYMNYVSCAGVTSSGDAVDYYVPCVEKLMKQNTLK